MRAEIKNLKRAQLRLLNARNLGHKTNWMVAEERSEYGQAIKDYRDAVEQYVAFHVKRPIIALDENGEPYRVDEG